MSVAEDFVSAGKLPGWSEPSEVAGDPRGERIEIARDRHRRVWDALAFQQALRPEKNVLGSASFLLAALDVGKTVGDVDAYERSVIRAENWVLKRDAGLGQHRFQSLFLGAKVSEEIAIRYCQLLAVHVEKDHDRRDRLEFIAARMLSTSASEGQRMMRWEEASPILDSVCGAFRAGKEARAEAGAFFHKSMARLHEYTSVSEIFESGLMADVRGFKTSLGRDFADPEILFASTAFSVETADRLAFLAEAEGLPRGEVSYRFGKLELELRKLFREMRKEDLRGRSAVLEKIDWHRHKWKQGLVRLKREKALQARPAMRKLFGAVLILGLAVIAASSWVLNENELVSVFYQRDLEEISSLLAAGSLSQGDASVFVGTMKDGRWVSLSPAERRSEADRIQKRLATRRISAALIRSGQAVAIKIDGSNVVVMEGVAR